jgi:hypothetical protein
MLEETFRLETEALMRKAQETIATINSYQQKDLKLLKETSKKMKKRRLRKNALNRLLSVYEKLLAGEKWEV